MQQITKSENKKCYKMIYMSLSKKTPPKIFRRQFYPQKLSDWPKKAHNDLPIAKIQTVREQKIFQNE